MPCDERYRSWVMRDEQAHDDPDLRPARLTRVSDCGARPGFRELHFGVDGEPWSWCFPPGSAGPRASWPAHTVILRSGPHGPIAQAAEEGSPGGAADLDLARAAQLVLAGAPVLVHRSLLGLPAGALTEDDAR